MSKENKHFYEFGPFRIDPEQRRLLRDQEAVPLTPKAFETLLILLRNSERVVSKDDLMNALWPDSFVEESNLSQNIFMLRKALGDSAQDARYIATVSGRGYRFTQKVKEVVAEGEAAPVAETQSPSVVVTEDDRPSLMSGRTGGIRVRALALVLGLAVLLTAGYLGWRAFHRPSVASPGRKMLAVLPFQNLTGDPEQEYFADGLTEELITKLGRLHPQQLGVIARTSVMGYKHSDKRLDQIGRELGVQYVLEGSVRRAGDRIRITAQLISVADQTHLWADDYDRQMKDVLSVQDDVAIAVADQTQLKLDPALQTDLARGRSVNPQAYEAYLRGRFFWNKRTEAGLNQAIVYFQRATSDDPNYAPAYAGMAQAYVLLPYYSGATANDAVSRAKSSAQQALRLDDNLAEAHAVLGMVEAGHFNWHESGHEYQRALQLNPNYATAHQWYAFLLWIAGSHDEALSEMDRARQLDPLSLIINTDESRLLCVAHQTDQAIALLQNAINLDPNFAEAHRALAIAYVQKAQNSEAISEASRGVELDPSDYERASLGYVYAKAGKPDEARKILAELRAATNGRKVSPVYLSFIYVGLGENNEALAQLEDAYRERSALFVTLPHEVIFDPLRSDARLQNLWQRAEQRARGE